MMFMDLSGVCLCLAHRRRLQCGLFVHLPNKKTPTQKQSSTNQQTITSAPMQLTTYKCVIIINKFDLNMRLQCWVLRARARSLTHKSLMFDSICDLVFLGGGKRSIWKCMIFINGVMESAFITSF